MSSWVTLYNESITFGEWHYTSVNNTASIFRFTHNYSNNNNSVVVVLEQADQESTVTLVDTKRFFLDSEARIITFNKPVFFNNRAIGLILIDTGDTQTETEVEVKIEYFIPDVIPPNAEKEQIDRLERKVDMLINQYLIKHYLLFLEQNGLETYQLTIEE